MFKILITSSIALSLIACSTVPFKKVKLRKEDMIQKMPGVKSTDSQDTGLGLVPAHYKELKYPEFTYVAPYPSDYRIELDSNTVVYLYPSPSLPLIKMDITFEESNISANEAEFPIYSTLGSMYKRGGTESFAPDVLEDTLEFQSTYLSVSLNERTSRLSVNSLKNNFPQALDILKDLVLKPKFDSKRLSVYKQQVTQALEHKYDKPSSISSDLYSHVMFGTHPSNWGLRVNEVKKLTPKKLSQFAKANFQGKKLYIGISGDFQKEEMILQIKKFLAELKPRTTTPEHLYPPTINNQAGIYIIDFPSKQTQIRMGQAFLQRPHPDYYPAAVASYILGAGGFTSRLVASIRTEHGLAYSVGSFTSSNYRRPSTSGIRLQTKVTSTTQAIELAFEEIKKLTIEGPTDQEVERAIEGMIASIPSLFDTPESTIDAFIYSEMRGRKASHYKDYPVALRKVTQARIQEVLKKYFTPEKMLITLVGPLAELNDPKVQIGAPLDSLGSVNVLTIQDLDKRK